MPDLLGLVEQLTTPAIRWIQFLNEIAGAFCITVGFVIAVAALVRAHVRHLTASFTTIRLVFSRYLSLALEFQLASDILTTALKPSWQDLGKLAAIAAIRTALNYFLSRESKEYRHKMDLGEELARSRVGAEPQKGVR